MAESSRSDPEAQPADDGGSLTDRAYRQLEELIVTLRLAPGEVLSEAALSKQLGIGRTPIREALQRLAREGLVVILPRRGILVAEINVRSQLELLKVRRELERLMSQLCARRATPAERHAFAELAADMERAASDDDDVAFMRQDRQLNAMISQCCRNEYALKALGLTHGLSRRFWYQHYRQVLDLPLCARLHAAQARAIAEGEPQAAAAASDRLIDYIETFTRATLDADSPAVARA
ncbi:DNA-binding transcriptional regulator, GntR family [Tistlia consotensis]|uniref:DNA-binding transcriptional regulator, GntR family n=1 Tax=Tistlia consotensis USBA 355 TaxID=560819 RepID=A0A1Y6C9Z4_9PROT|nr:GntR family transcriptional regulator [Tistlia consotensis]SMF53724.1 DNA-binding transcriptional regulator, GntR family [Tistlia consotensis USBA 355]SNR85903.1 DNA-binding transcriptional regulator, GntR family [Tistlia consotensis]